MCTNCRFLCNFAAQIEVKPNKIWDNYKKDISRIVYLKRQWQRESTLIFALLRVNKVRK